MRKRLVIAVAVPVLVLLLLLVLRDACQKFDLHDYFIILGNVMHVVYSWPIMLADLAGLLGKNAELYYGNWQEASRLFSLLVQAALVYVIDPANEKDNE